jgi:putative acetyltransferase
VAELDGHVVGHCLCSRAWLDGSHPIIVLGPIGVHPDVQGRGIGGALVRASIAAAEAAGERLVVLLGHPTYYPRFGFRSARGLGILPPVEGWSDAAWMALPLRGWDATGPVARGTVRLPAAFPL